ncbi:MAG: MbnP family protein, partial [Bacteroidota bacterium]
MNNKNIWAIALLAILVISCGEDDVDPNETGTFQLFFENMAGSSQITLKDEGNQTYDFETASGQKFNLSELGYFISEIKLEGPDGAFYEDEISVTANESRGYYHVQQGVSGSGSIDIVNVPAGKYDKVTFTLGVKEDGITEGAVGGVLDPAGDAARWFWRWNSGYIHFKMEGNAEDSGQLGNEFAEAGTFAFHIGGWKDVAPDDNFVNNTRTITLDLDGTVTVNGELSPLAHVIVDVMKVLDETNVNFESTFSVHSPVSGQPFANNLSEMFFVHHV